MYLINGLILYAVCKISFRTHLHKPIYYYTKQQIHGNLQNNHVIFCVKEVNFSHFLFQILYLRDVQIFYSSNGMQIIMEQAS